MCDQNFAKIKKWVEVALKQYDIFNYEIEIEGQTDKGDGFAGDINFIKVFGHTKSGAKKTIYLATKSTKDNEKVREKAPLKEASFKEIFVYDKVRPTFQKFQEERGVEKWIDIMPYCYATDVSDNSEVLIFENLRTEGFQLWNKSLPMTIRHIQLVLEAYGWWHALSFALKIQKPDVFKELVRDNVNMFTYVLTEMKFDVIMEREFQNAMALNENDLDILKHVDYSEEDVMYAFKDMYFEEADYHVILHGDCWNNNFLFKSLDDKTNPSAVRVLDWQCSGLGSPAFDLSHFIYSCVDTEKYPDVKELLKIYYNNFTKYLTLLGCDPEKAFSFEKLIEHWKKFSRFGLFLSCFVIRVCLMETSKVPDFTESIDKDEDLTETLSFGVSTDQEHLRRIRRSPVFLTYKSVSHSTMEVLKERHDVLTFLEKVSAEQGIPKYTIIDAATNEKGEGYLGQIFMITIKDDFSDKELRVVVKVAFVDEKIRKFVPIKKSFLNEIYFYQHIRPTFRKMEANHNIEHTEFSPQCFKVLVENEKEMLCLENLKTLKFEMFEKTSVLDDEHVSFIFKTYGRFHGYSFVLKDQQPEVYKQLTSEIHNIYEEFVINPEGNFKEYLTDLIADVRTYLLDKEDDVIISKFEKYADKGVLDCFYDITTQTCNYSSILHGDCWSNNMMFKYETSEDNRKLVDMRLLDFQIVKVGSPVCDLSYCLYSGGSKGLFDNLEKYLKIYYESLEATLKQFGSDAEVVFPFQALKEDWKKYARFGMIMSCCAIKIKCTNKDDILDLTDDFDVSKPIKVKFNEEEYGKRTKEILCHLCEIDAL